MMLIFFVGPGLDGGGVIVDGMARLGPAFILFAAGFFDTSDFCFLMAAWGGIRARNGAGSVRHPHLFKNSVQTTTIQNVGQSEGIIFLRPEAP
jgi:hypothetical protein